MNKEEILSKADMLIEKAEKYGADASEITIFKTKDVGIDVRNGNVENSDYSDSVGVGIRVFIGRKSSTVSGSDISQDALDTLLERAMGTVKHVPEDPYAEIADENLLEKNPYSLAKEYDETKPNIENLKQKAFEAEEKALSFKGITNSEGAGCSYGEYLVGLVTSNGFRNAYHKTLYGLSCCVLAGEGTNMERDYAYHTRTFFNDLKSPEEIGEEAATRTLKRLNPTQMKSGKVPVIFDPRAGRSLLGHFAGAISADNIARKTSFLGNVVGEKIFSDEIKIIDDPHMKGGLGSCPFDMEGVKNPVLNLVENGVLNHFLSHGASSRQLNIENNGRAKRSISAAPYPASTNMYMENGHLSPDDLMSDINYGLYVTDTIGHGINGVTGDYSIGASGFLIENGKIANPVSEITIASNLKDMFLNMTPANDLIFESRKNVPTLRIEDIMVAGN